MTYEQSKAQLRKSKTLVERETAILDALRLGMPLNEIEEYLDWLDLTSPLPIEDPTDAPTDNRANSPEQAPIEESPNDDSGKGE